jgi:hypothetical protein
MNSTHLNQFIEISETAHLKLQQILSQSADKNQTVRLFINGYS